MNNKLADNQNNKILMVGPAQLKDQVGGAVVLMQSLVQYCSNMANVQFVNNNRGGKTIPARAVNFCVMLLEVLCQLPKFDVLMLNGSQKTIKYLTPFFYIVAKLFRKRFVVRAFGGWLREEIDSLPSWWRKIVQRTISKSDLVIVETIELVKILEDTSVPVFWYPNVRSPSSIRRPERSFSGKFVFVGSVQEAKGVGILLEAFKKLGTSETCNLNCDFYGPLVEQHWAETINAVPGCQYNGIVEREALPQLLCDNDVLVLPTFYSGEGYPGVIIEAFSVGLPVIATSWKCIPEIVDQQNGILIPIQNAAALVEAINSLTNERYSKLAQGALASFSRFDSNVVNAALIERLRKLGHDS